MKKINMADKIFADHDKAMESLGKIFDQAPFENKEYYAQWCAQFYYFVAHATRLLAASAARLGLDRDGIHIRFLDHCQEEKHHEKLFVKDIDFLGFNIEDLPEHPMTAQLYQSQYYLIDYHDPVALFGSIYYLEGMSIALGKGLYGRLKKAHSDSACNFVRVHVADDEDHIEKAKKALRSFSEEELKVVWWSMKQTEVIYEAIMHALNQAAVKAKRVA